MNMFLFWGIFLLLVLLTLIESLNRKLISRSVAVGLFIVLTLLVGFRPPQAVADYEVYILFFELFGPPANYFEDFFTLAVFEPMYYLIPTVLHYVFDLPNYVNISIWIYAIVGTGLVMLVLRKVSALYYASLLTLYSYYFLLHEFTQIRAAVAVSFLLLSVYYRYWKNNRAMLICIFVSMLFHYSSILALVLILLPAYNLNRKVWIALATLTFLISFVNFNSVLSLLNVNVGALSVKQEAYVNGIVDVPINRRSLWYLLMLLDTLVVIYYAHNIYKQNPYIYLFVKLQVIGLLSFQVLSASPVFSLRVSEYFFATHLVCFPAVLHLFKYRFWPTVALCVVLAGVFFFFLQVSELVKLQYYAF
ncbi:MAG: EpsG family protein [Sphingobacteriaceae bacterium]|nr:MAG: EpsG family protein [Sphingobacteriaceae bacterium]